MLQQNEPEDFVIGTGENHTIKEFINECLFYIPETFEINHKIYKKFEWKLDEQNRDILWDMENSKLVIGIDEQYYRPAEVDLLLADASKAKEKLGWEPKVTFRELVKRMMKNELK